MTPPPQAQTEAAGRLLLLPARPAVVLCLLYIRGTLPAVHPWVIPAVHPWVNPAVSLRGSILLCPSVGHPCCAPVVQSGQSGQSGQFWHKLCKTPGYCRLVSPNCTGRTVLADHARLVNMRIWWSLVGGYPCGTRRYPYTSRTCPYTPAPHGTHVDGAGAIVRFTDNSGQTRDRFSGPADRTAGGTTDGQLFP